MSRDYKRRRDLEREIATLKDQIKQFSGVRCQKPEDALTLLVLENAPFTVWACRRTFDIILWNKGCELRYACPKEKAIGKNFFDMFAHEHEREQAKRDCLSIIDDGATFINFIADDHDSTGKPIRMLTNCFRVFDTRYQEFVQAEIGVDISDLRLSEDRHRNIQQLGMRMQELKTQSELNEFVSAKQFLQIRLRDINLDKTRQWQAKHEQLLSFNRESQEYVNEGGRRRLQEKTDELNGVRASIDSRFNDLDERISKAKVPAELDQVRADVASFVAWTLPGE